MKKQHKKWLGMAFVFAGLSAALVLGIIGSCTAKQRTVSSVPRQMVSIEELDAKAKPHFKAAEQNIHSVVKKMTKSKNLWKLKAQFVRRSERRDEDCSLRDWGRYHRE